MNSGGRVLSVESGSLAQEIGIEPGDLIRSVNGHLLRDVIDFRFYAAEELVVLEVVRDGVLHRLEVERDLTERWGISFTGPTFDGMRECNNHCPFCFVQQMPPGLRPSLYLRDDDYRYSFLYGNYVTLTNLDEADWDRLAEQRLSPLYVSVHAADPTVRRRMLGNRRAPDVRQQLTRLGDLGIHVHTQVVVCPGMNDGDVLRDTIREMAALHPVVLSLAVVPVGLTKLHNPRVRPLDRGDARAILEMADAFWSAPPASIHDTWLYASDEIYLLAERALPPGSFYQEDAQYENGVGMVRCLLDDWDRCAQMATLGGIACEGMTWVCGTLVAPVLGPIADEFQRRFHCTVDLLPVRNVALGDTVTVSGLLFGQDVLAALARARREPLTVLPRGMFDQTGRRTLDDLTPREMEAATGTRILLADAVSDVIDQLAPRPRD
jgi:putative radical SAM enzyme (TIGR03279 family)